MDEVLQEAQDAPKDTVEDTATQEVITQSVPAETPKAEAAPVAADDPADVSNEKPEEPKTEEPAATLEEAPAKGEDDGAKDDAKVVGGSVKEERKNSWPVEVEPNCKMKFKSILFQRN